MAVPIVAALSQRDQFLLALGKFIDTFVNVEANLRELVGTFARIDDETRRAMLSGARIAECLDHVRRIHRAKDKPLPPSLDRAFLQLVQINKARNTILHYGAQRSHRVSDIGKPPQELPYLMLSSNRQVALTPDAVEQLELTTATLEALRYDTRRIVRVLRIFIGDKPDEYEIRELKEFAREPWRYTPPAPKKTRPPSRPKSQRPSRPPPASGA